MKPLQPSADLGAAMIVVELEVGEAGLLALLERRGPGVERHAVQAIVDLARLRRETPRPAAAASADRTRRRRRAATSALSSPVGRPATP